MTEIERKEQERCDAIIEEAMNDPEITNPKIEEPKGLFGLIAKIFKI